MTEEFYLLLLKAKNKAKDLTKSIAINIDKEGDRIYSEALDIVIILTKLEEQMNLENTNKNIYPPDNINEINKVKRRVSKWKKNPYQCNYKILDAYFKIRKEKNNITKETLERYCKEIYGSDFSFLINFSQMYNIAEKNHGKVFEVLNDEVKLWNPVKDFIEETWNKK